MEGVESVGLSDDLLKGFDTHNWDITDSEEMNI